MREEETGTKIKGKAYKQNAHMEDRSYWIDTDEATLEDGNTTVRGGA